MDRFSMRTCAAMEVVGPRYICGSETHGSSSSGKAWMRSVFQRMPSNTSKVNMRNLTEVGSTSPVIVAVNRGLFDCAMRFARMSV